MGASKVDHRNTCDEAGTQASPGESGSRTVRPPVPQVKNGEDTCGTTVRSNKIESHLDFDKSKNPWTKVLSKVQRQVSKLKNELHFMQTFAAHANKSGPKIVKQTHESQRCAEAVKRAKQAIREHLQECEKAHGHRAIPPSCFDDNGELDFEHILCSACKDPDADDKNDIVLCDGQFCNRAYHVKCLPVKASFNVDDLPEEEGWLCPACDCRYDILWDLAETFDLDFHSLEKCRWHDILADDDPLPDEADVAGPSTILNTQLPSDDESDDEDFNESDDDDDPDAAGPSKSQAASISHKKEDEDCAGPSTSPVPSDDDDDSSDDDSDEYEDDDLEDGTDIQAMLQLLEADTDADPSALVVDSKRKRTHVDYTKLNAEMFGDLECYEDEGIDEEFEVTAAERAAMAKRAKYDA